jgi:Zn-dependent protease with chaperone function
MDRERFEALVARMEGSARAHPTIYRWRVLAWALLGYGFLLLVVTVMLALCAVVLLGASYMSFAVIKLLIILVPGVWVLLRSLWVRFDPPEGVPVARRDAPQLFALLDDLRRGLRTPRIHEVRITPALNAAVTQIPRLGFLGWHRNYLLLGLPLMKGLTVQQFKAVLAHELGHLSRGHARLGNWIYRLRMIWAQLDHVYSAQARAGASVIRRFFHWYSPRFNATSFPLARSNEYEADAAAVRLTSAATAAEALTGVNVLSRYLEQKYWPDIHAAAKDQPQPAFTPYHSFLGAAVLAVSEGERQKWLADELARRTSIDDTHPALTDRLAAVGAPARFAPPEQGSGAELLLGSRLEELEERFDTQWRDRIESSWKQFHEDTQKARARLAELEAAGERPQADCNELLERADLQERVGGGAQPALELRRAAVGRFPESEEAHVALGRQLLAMDDAAGVAHIEPLVDKHPAWTPALCEMLRDYFWRAGDKAQAHQWHERFIAGAQRMEEARAERKILYTKDQYVPHGLAQADLAGIVEALRGIPEIKRAYLVRKVTRHFPDVPFYAFGFSCVGMVGLTNRPRIAAAMQAVQAKIAFPGETLIISVEGVNRGFAPVFRKVSGSRIR